MVIRFTYNSKVKAANKWEWLVNGAGDEFSRYPSLLQWPTHEQMLEWFEKKLVEISSYEEKPEN